MINKNIYSLLRQKPVQRFIRYCLRLGNFIIFYAIVSLTVICSFAYIYHGMDIGEPFLHSLYVYLGQIDFKIGIVELFELFVQIVVAYIAIGSAVTKCMQPINPLRFSSCAVLKGQTVWFRYWIMLKKGSFLYDVMIRAWIGDDDFFRNEYNKDYPFVSESITLNSIRGIRQVPIDVSSFCDGDYEQLKKYKIVLMINGVNKDGTMFTNSKAYGFRTDVFNGCRFAEVQIDKNHETPSINQEDEKKRYFYKYQNFNKIIIEDEKLRSDLESQALKHGGVSVLSKQEEKQKDPWYVQLINNITALFYNQNSIYTILKRWIEKKCKIDFS